MKLKELFPAYSSSDSEVSSLEIDSRKVTKNSVFFALKGKITDGEKFIESAIKNGAIAVICSKSCPLNLSQIIKVDDVYEVLIDSLKIFYCEIPYNILAVTGTNGKTSVTYFIQQLLEILDKKSAAIGTTGIKVSDQSLQTSLTAFALTTPDIVSLYKNLSILKTNGIDDVTIEASSIGLEQARLAGINISLGAFTNFTQDHLDYHGSMEKYFESKMLLFKNVLKANDFAILNADIPEFEEIRKICEENRLQIFSYSVNKDSADAVLTNNGKVKIFEKEYDFEISVAGDFQKSNMLCALLSVVSYYDLNESEVKILSKHLSEIKAAEGRMQLVAKLNNNAQIFIDYAHTPDALQNVLETTQKISHNKLHVLFGCGGNRDATKRPLMGKIASDLADFVIVTDDNPRFEDAKAIRKEILAACDLSKTIEIDDRRKAIEQAISKLQDNDILIIAGKGHEKYQIIGEEKFEFDEEKIVKEALSKLANSVKYNK